MRPILYQLAHRLITSSPTPSYANADRFHLHLTILRELKLYEEANKLLDSDIGKSICATNLSCNELRREIYVQQGRIQLEAEQAEHLIVEKKLVLQTQLLRISAKAPFRDRNWLEFLSVIEGAIPATSPEGTTVDLEATGPKVSRVRELFLKIAEEDGTKDRSAPLALLEVEKRALHHGLSQGWYFIATNICSFIDWISRPGSITHVAETILRQVRRQGLLLRRSEAIP